MTHLRNKHFPTVRAYEKLMQADIEHKLLTLAILNKNGELEVTEEFRRIYMPNGTSETQGRFNYTRDLKYAITKALAISSSLQEIMEGI